MPTSYNNTGKPGYIYDSANDSWNLISGKVDTTSGYEWSGSHTFLATITAIDHLIGKKGLNNFLNPSARDSSISSPVSGTICLIRQDGSGTVINELQYYDGTSWRTLIPSQTGNEQKFLQTDGIITSWSEIDTISPNFLSMGG